MRRRLPERDVPERDVPLPTLYSGFHPRPKPRAWVYAFWNSAKEPLYVGKVVRFDYMGRLDEHSHKSPWWPEVTFYSVAEADASDVLLAESQAIGKPAMSRHVNSVAMRRPPVPAR